MSDELFGDELELTERGADETGLPRAAIASQPIRDGSRALLHDGYDVQIFHDAAGEHPKVVSERLGHATITLTLDTYSHVLPTMQQAAADRLEALLFGSR